MKILRRELLFENGDERLRRDIESMLAEIETGIMSIKHPAGADGFYLNPIPKGNGVKPIKSACMAFLEGKGWRLEYNYNVDPSLANRGPIDAVKILKTERRLALEWETGNISSSHRAMNKMSIGILRGDFVAASLILPSHSMYKYLTDRVGNFRELAPYFDLWRSLPVKYGAMIVFEIEHDGEDASIEPIMKGTDGRALR